MERQQAIKELADAAQHLRLEMKLSSTGVLPPEILCIFAWEECILRRYAEIYASSPVEVQARINKAKQLCADSMPDYIKKDRMLCAAYVNRIMKGTKSPAVVQTIPCPTCHMGESVVSLMDNMADARPFWTYFLDFDIGEKRT